MFIFAENWQKPFRMKTLSEVWEQSSLTVLVSDELYLTWVVQVNTAILGDADDNIRE